MLYTCAPSFAVCVRTTATNTWPAEPCATEAAAAREAAGGSALCDCALPDGASQLTAPVADTSSKPPCSCAAGGASSPMLGADAGKTAKAAAGSSASKGASSSVASEASSAKATSRHCCEEPLARSSR